ncbi:50S ribosomal protein L23 [Buchnera aphidicola (Neophyllaphis podocarpi)]|uniref:50S ribosomal protein L23 n=1 Tax=Buchnera aphidicola TaxID=9 RepID=UPI0031B8B315
MIYEELLLKVLKGAHISEKTSTIKDNSNTFVLKVNKNSTKVQIKHAIKKIFDVDVKNVNTILSKGKIKKQGNRNIKKSNWKKAYVTLKIGQNLDFIGNS